MRSCIWIFGVYMNDGLSSQESSLPIPNILLVYRSLIFSWIFFIHFFYYYYYLYLCIEKYDSWVMIKFKNSFILSAYIFIYLFIWVHLFFSRKLIPKYCTAIRFEIILSLLLLLLITELGLDHKLEPLRFWF